MKLEKIQTSHLNENQIKIRNLSYQICRNYFLTSLFIALIEPKTAQSQAIACSINQLNNLRIISSSDVEAINKTVLSILHLSGLAVCLLQIKS